MPPRALQPSQVADEEFGLSFGASKSDKCQLVLETAALAGLVNVAQRRSAFLSWQRGACPI